MNMDKVELKSKRNEVQIFFRKIWDLMLSWKQPVALEVYSIQALEVFGVQVDGEVPIVECEVHTGYHRCGSMEEEVWT